MDKLLNSVVVDRLLQYGTTMIGGILVLFVGWYIISLGVKSFRHFLHKREIDQTLVTPATAILSTLLKIALFLAVASTLGIQTTSFLAVLSAAGLAVGLALQGSLSNLAGGALLLVLRPIKVGEFIDAQSSQGFVREINLFQTLLETNDKAFIYIPNGELANHKIINLSRSGAYRLNIPLGVSYNANLEQTRQVLINVMLQNPLVLQTPEPKLVVSALGDSSVNLLMRPWCDAADAKPLEVQLLEAAKIALDEVGIEIPYPHQITIERKLN